MLNLPSYQYITGTGQISLLLKGDAIDVTNLIGFDFLEQNLGIFG